MNHQKIEKKKRDADIIPKFIKKAKSDPKKSKTILN